MLTPTPSTDKEIADVKVMLPAPTPTEDEKKKTKETLRRLLVTKEKEILRLKSLALEKQLAHLRGCLQGQQYASTACGTFAGADTADTTGASKAGDHRDNPPAAGMVVAAAALTMQGDMLPDQRNRLAADVRRPNVAVHGERPITISNAVTGTKMQLVASDMTTVGHLKRKIVEQLKNEKEVLQQRKRSREMNTLEILAGGRCCKAGETMDRLIDTVDLTFVWRDKTAQEIQEEEIHQREIYQREIRLEQQVSTRAYLSPSEWSESEDDFVYG